MPKFTAVPMQPCDSSQLKEFGYDPATRTLAIRFRSKSGPGSVYTYDNVPPEVYAEMQAAESKGKFFGTRIKGHADKFPFTRIHEDEEEEKERAS